jgi:hypothetical protein
VRRPMQSTDCGKSPPENSRTDVKASPDMDFFIDRINISPLRTQEFTAPHSRKDGRKEEGVN